MITGTSRFHERPGSPSRRRLQSSNPEASGSTASEEHEVGPTRLEELERDRGALGRQDVVPVVGELLFEEGPNGRLALDDENRGPLFVHAPKLTPLSPRPQMSFRPKPSQAVGFSTRVRGGRARGGRARGGRSG